MNRPRIAYVSDARQVQTIGGPIFMIQTDRGFDHFCIACSVHIDPVDLVNAPLQWLVAIGNDFFLIEITGVITAIGSAATRNEQHRENASEHS